MTDSELLSYANRVRRTCLVTGHNCSITCRRKRDSDRVFVYQSADRQQVRNLCRQKKNTHTCRDCVREECMRECP